jgi:hypothetical protein
MQGSDGCGTSEVTDNLHSHSTIGAGDCNPAGKRIARASRNGTFLGACWPCEFWQCPPHRLDGSSGDETGVDQRDAAGCQARSGIE